MSKEQKKAVWPWIVALVVGLPAVYVLSSGPAIWILCKGYLPERAFEVVYAPMTWLEERSSEPIQSGPLPIT